MFILFHGKGFNTVWACEFFIYDLFITFALFSFFHFFYLTAKQSADLHLMLGFIFHFISLKPNKRKIMNKIIILLVSPALIHSINLSRLTPFLHVSSISVEFRENFTKRLLQISLYNKMIHLSTVTHRFARFSWQFSTSFTGAKALWRT